MLIVTTRYFSDLLKGKYGLDRQKYHILSISIICIDLVNFGGIV